MSTPIIKGESFTLIGYLEYDNYVIMNPELDETGRFPVNPVTYYKCTAVKKNGYTTYYASLETLLKEEGI